MPERIIQTQKDVDLYFIDYVNAFDKIRHKDMLELLSYLDTVAARDLKKITLGV